MSLHPNTESSANDFASRIGRTTSIPSVASVIRSLVDRKLLREDQVAEILARPLDSSDDIWHSPFLSDVHEHTRAYIDALPVQLGVVASIRTSEIDLTREN